MVSRMSAPGRWELLEWGMATDTPRSSVKDHKGRMIFTGSVVRTRGEGRQGTVTKLHSRTKVSVRFGGDLTATECEAAGLLVQPSKAKQAPS